MLYFILAFIILLTLVYFLLPNKKDNLSEIIKQPSNNIINKIFNSNSVNPICGRKNLYCKDRLIRPYMFRNLAKDYVNNHHIDWNIEVIDSSKDLYRMNLSDRYCAYNIDNDICLYELDGKEIIDENKPGCKKTNLCSLSSIIDNTPHYDPNNTQFIIKKYSDDGYTIQSTDGNYICNIDNRMSVSDEFTDDCIWQFK